MIRPRYDHASDLLNEVMFSCGGFTPTDLSGWWRLSVWRDHEVSSHHEAFGLDGETKELKEMPIALFGHTATNIDSNRYLISGGRGDEVSLKNRYETSYYFWC